MPILTIQRQFRELGRIRLGDKGPKGPRRLATWRLTSADRELLEAAATHYSGEVVAWPDAPDGDAWQLITGTDELDILVPPGQPLTQWNELWSGAGCQRRCDGRREWLRDTPCLCPADPAERNELAAKGEACKPTSRLQVILPKLPDLGTFLFVSHGYYAAAELAGTVDLLAAAAATGGPMIRASLWIDQRTVKRPGQPTRKFPVPAIRIHATMTELLAARAEGGPALTGGRVPAQLTTSAPLPADPSFAQSAGAATTPGPDQADESPGGAPADAAPTCPHPPDQLEAVDAGVHCKRCDTIIATHAQGRAGSPEPPAPSPVPASAPLPPGGGSSAPSTMPDAQSRVGALAIRHGLVARIESDDDWAAFDDVLRGHGIEPPPLEATAEAIAEWNALGDRIAAGEFSAADDPAGVCGEHGEPWKWVPPGVKRDGSGKKYNGFFTCPTRDCPSRPSDAWRRAHRPADWKAV